MNKDRLKNLGLAVTFTAATIGALGVAGQFKREQEREIDERCGGPLRSECVVVPGFCVTLGGATPSCDVYVRKTPDPSPAEGAGE